MTETPSKPADDNESADGKSPHQLQVEDELFRHEMTLKHHDHQLITTEERLTLTTIQALSQGFLITAVIAGLAVLAGFSVAEVIRILQDIIFVLAGLAFFCIGLFSSISGGHGLVETFSSLREGPPEPPSELIEEYTDENK